MKSFCFWILLLALPTENGYSQSVGLLVGQMVMPGNYFALRYSHYSNLPINAAISVFQESTRRSGLLYSCYGLDVLAEYASTQNHYDQTVFGYKAGIGGTWLIENEPWVYQGLSPSQRMNYGIVGELTGEWGMSSIFCLSAFVQQKVLLRKQLGTKQFVFGLGLKMLLNP